MARREGSVTERASPARRKSHFSTPVNDDELEFIRAIEEFKRQNDQPFPSWSEVLLVLKRLGYEKRAPHTK